MTATDELRKLLDNRGVEYGSGFGGDTLWTGRYGIEWRWDKQEDTLAMYSHTITPEQAIAATLGTPERTCHIEERYIDWYCDACFEMVGTCDTTSELFIDGNAIKLWNYCPNCGRAVEQ